MSISLDIGIKSDIFALDAEPFKCADTCNKEKVTVTREKNYLKSVSLHIFATIEHGIDEIITLCG